MSKTQKSKPAVDTIWFTRCAGGGRGGVPTASGIAYKLGWLEEEFRDEGIQLRTLQEDADPSLRHHHYDHALPTLIREGGNLFALPARAQGARTRLIGLTWIDEGQAILVRPDSDIRSPQQLEGRRLALPAYRPEDLAENRRGRSIARHMSLRGYQGALASVGATLDAVRLVEVGAASASENAGGFGQSYQPLLDGEVDAIYVKGAPAADAARKHGLVVGIDLDKLPERRFRVNNGTPRPVTVHEDFLRDHPDLLVRFLRQTLRAAQWARTNLEGVQKILQGETGASAAGVAAAYRSGFHLSLAPDLSDERLDLFRQHKDFLLAHGILDRDFDFDAWVDRRPLEEAARTLEEARAVA